MANNREIFSKHYGLERGSWFYIILVLLEHAQRVKGYELQENQFRVLILVLLEHAQRVIYSASVE